MHDEPRSSAFRSESDEFCKQLMDNLHDGIYCLDSRRTITYWNKAAERLTGYSAQEVLGSKCKDNILMHVDGSGCQLCKDNCPVSHAMASGVPHDGDMYPAPQTRPQSFCERARLLSF